MTQRKLAKQQADHFERVLGEKKNEKVIPPTSIVKTHANVVLILLHLYRQAFHVDEIQKLQAALADSQAALNTCRKRLEQTDHKKEDLDGLLKAQQSRTDLVRQKLGGAEVLLNVIHMLPRMMSSCLLTE